MFLYFQFSGQSMKITFTKNNFTDTVTSSQSKIILCFQFGGQKKSISQKNNFRTRDSQKTKIGELSTEQKSHKLISYFYFAGSKEQFLGPEIVVSSNQNFQ